MNWVSRHKDTKAQTHQEGPLQKILSRGPSWCLCAFVSLCLFVSPASAQQRPLLTEDPRLIPNGSFVMESGFGYAHNAQFPLAGLKGDEYSAFVNGLNFSLGSRAEFQINGTIQNFVKMGNNWRNDWGDWS